MRDSKIRELKTLSPTCNYIFERKSMNDDSDFIPRELIAIWLQEKSCSWLRGDK